MSPAGPYAAPVGAMAPQSSESLAQLAQASFRPPGAVPFPGLMQPPGMISTQPLGQGLGRFMQSLLPPERRRRRDPLGDCIQIDFLAAPPDGVSPDVWQLLLGED